MNNASVLYEDILFDDPSKLAEESIAWGGCMISEIQLSKIFEVPTHLPWIATR